MNQKTRLIACRNAVFDPAKSSGAGEPKVGKICLASIYALCAARSVDADVAQ